MKTVVLMKRELFGMEIAQNNQTQYFSGTDLERAGNAWRLNNKLPYTKLSSYLSLNSTIEFMSSIEKLTGKPAKIASRGRAGVTWLHPYLFIDFALHMSPQLKVEVYGWMYDFLIKYRNMSGDSYKKMSGALYLNTSNKTTFPQYMVKVANLIRTACGVEDWEHATEEQLQLRDKIHENVALLCDVLKDNETAVRIAITKTLGLK